MAVKELGLCDLIHFRLTGHLFMPWERFRRWLHLLRHLPGALRGGQVHQGVDDTLAIDPKNGIIATWIKCTCGRRWQ